MSVNNTPALLAQQNETNRIAVRGSLTSIDGHTQSYLGLDIRGEWSRAQPGRVQMFFSETEWANGIYFVAFDYTVLSAPINLKFQSELIWKALGWRAVVRAIDITVETDVVVSVTVIAMLTPRT